jgi:acetylornithine deacetylase
MKSVEDLLLDLVAIPSVSAINNRAVADYVIGCLDPNHWDIREDPYVDAAGTPKANLIATSRNGSPHHAELAFVCHSDTVPFESNWAHAVNPVCLDGRIYGRGSCDVKGFLACVLTAFALLDVHKLGKPLALIVTADEEVGCVGAKHLAAQKSISTRYMLIGEPTGLRPIRAGKGYCLATITVRGREAHSAYPAQGHSAIYDAARIALRLEALSRELTNDRDETFDPPFTTLNIGIIEGGTAKNIIPGQCRLTIEWRPIPGQPAQHVANRISGELAGFDAELHVQRMDPPFAPSKTEHLAALLSSLTELPPGTIAFGSEAAHLACLAEETVVFGPGDMTVAHRTGEFVAVADLRLCIRHLQSVIETFCR